MKKSTKCSEENSNYNTYETRKVKPSKGWMDNQLIEQVKEGDRLFKQWNNHQLALYTEIFKRGTETESIT